MKLTRTGFAVSSLLALTILTTASSNIHANVPDKGTLNITVRDSNGAVVPGASISARKQSCKCSDCSPSEKPCKCCFQQVTSDDSGVATFTLDSGKYSVTIEVSGFESVEQEVELSDGESKSLAVKVGSTDNLGKSNRGTSDLVFKGKVQN